MQQHRLIESREWWTWGRCPRCSQAAVLADAHDEWQVHDRRYLSETSMALLAPQEVDSDTDPAAITSGP